MITARITLAFLMHPDRLNPGQCGCGVHLPKPSSLRVSGKWLPTWILGTDS